MSTPSTERDDDGDDEFRAELDRRAEEVGDGEFITFADHNDQRDD